MCGICGWIDFDRELGEPEARRELADMTATMAHRGPDDGGTLVDGPPALGHRRLAIIDLKGGRQPMTLQEGGRHTLALVYNGEIYNYRELRQLLIALGHRFDTSSDTEVVLPAHHEWGCRDPRAAVSELNGMFAYAVWDIAKRELLLVRDRLGIKPLYYYPTEHGVLFGSEPKAILANRLAERAMDMDGLRRTLCFIADPHNTVFRGMREVRPGNIVRVTRHGIQEMTYWQLTDTGHTDDVPTTVRRVGELLEDTIQRQLVADVPRCLLLSGGLDCSALTALAARFGNEQVRSFALDFVGYTDDFSPRPMRATPDGPYVQEVAKLVGTDHTDITLSVKDLMDSDVRASTLHARDLPLTWGDIDSSLYLLFRAMRPHSKLALSGEAADEIFGGYSWFHDLAHVHADTFAWCFDGGGVDTGADHLDASLIERLDLPNYRYKQVPQSTCRSPWLNWAELGRSARASHARDRLSLSHPLSANGARPQGPDKHGAGYRGAGSLLRPPPSRIRVWRPMGPQDVRRTREELASCRHCGPASAVRPAASQELVPHNPRCILRERAAHPVHCTAE